MSSLEIKVRPLHPAQDRIVEEAKRFNVIDCGRRFGKTDLGIWLCLSESRGLLGQDCKLGYFAPQFKILDEAWREMIRRYFPIIRNKNAQKRRFETIFGSSIEFWSLEDPDAGRSRKYHRVIVDEAAMCRHLKAAWQESIRPTLLDYEGDAWFLSTPKGKDYFHQLYNRGMEKDAYPDWMSWQMPTSANPYIPETEIQAAKDELPEQVYKQEILAEFIDDGGLVFRHIDDCTMTENPETVPNGDDVYVAGVDWGKLNDFTVVIVFNATKRYMVEMLRINQIDYLFQARVVGDVLKKWKCRDAWVELNSIGQPIYEKLKREQKLPVTGFNTTHSSKTEAIEALSLAFQNLNISILPNDVLKRELEVFNIERTQSGNWRYCAPEGYHDDCVIALMLAWQAAISCPNVKRKKLKFKSFFS